MMSTPCRPTSISLASIGRSGSRALIAMVNEGSSADVTGTKRGSAVAADTEARPIDWNKGHLDLDSPMQPLRSPVARTRRVTKDARMSVIASEPIGSGGGGAPPR